MAVVTAFLDCPRFHIVYPNYRMVEINRLLSVEWMDCSTKGRKCPNWSRWWRIRMKQRFGAKSVPKFWLTLLIIIKLMSNNKVVSRTLVEGQILYNLHRLLNTIREELTKVNSCLIICHLWPDNLLPCKMWHHQLWRRRRPPDINRKLELKFIWIAQKNWIWSRKQLKQPNFWIKKFPIDTNISHSCMRRHFLTHMITLFKTCTFQMKSPSKITRLNWCPNSLKHQSIRIKYKSLKSHS